MDKTKKKSRLPRKLLGLWLLVELVSLPATAQIVDRVSFKIAPTVITTPVPHQPAGKKSFLVATNTPFTVEVAGTVGDVDVRVAHTGYYGDLRYGTKAQMPGPRTSCVQGRLAPVVAYRADRKTAATRGDVQEHAVRVDVTFDPVADPEIAFVAAEESTASEGMACATARDSLQLAP